MASASRRKHINSNGTIVYRSDVNKEINDFTLVFNHCPDEKIIKILFVINYNINTVFSKI